MSVVMPDRRLLGDAHVDAGEPYAARPPALRDRLRAVMHQIDLDRRLASGERIGDDHELTVRAWQITRPAARKRLADFLLESAEWLPECGGTARPHQPEVAAARGEIERLAERLRDQRPVRPRGVALARELLAEGDGPLYVASGDDELVERVRRALAELG